MISFHVYVFPFFNMAFVSQVMNFNHRSISLKVGLVEWFWFQIPCLSCNDEWNSLFESSLNPLDAPGEAGLSYDQDRSGRRMFWYDASRLDVKKADIIIKDVVQFESSIDASQCLRFLQLIWIRIFNEPRWMVSLKCICIDYGECEWSIIFLINVFIDEELYF